MKKLNFSRIISLLTALTLMVAMLAACTQKPVDTNTSSAAVSSAEKPAEKDLSPITIEWYINESWFDAPSGNLALEMIKEQTGVDVKFIVPVGDAAEKLNTMIATNVLPDLVTLGWYDAKVPDLSTPEYAYSYNELIDKYDPTFYDVIDKNVFNWYKQDDGKTYGYPCNSVAPADIDAGLTSNRTFLVRKDIYTAIGSPDMRTPEGFTKALEDAKKAFPKALNGQPLIPFGTNPFTVTGNNGLEDVLLEFLSVPREINGEFFPTNCGNPSPEYIRWLKAFRLMNEKGLIPTDVFVDERAQIEEKVQQGRYFAMLYQAQDAMNPLGLLYKNNPDSSYIAVDGPSNTNLDAHKLGVPGYSGWEITLVTKNCKAPERALALLKWGHTTEEGQKALFLGKEGVTYDVVDSKPVIKDEVAKMKNEDMGGFKNKYNTYNEIWMFAKTSNLIAWEPKPLMPFAQYKEWGVGKAAFYGEYDNIAPPAETDEDIISKKVLAKWAEILPKLIKAKSDAEFDKIWADYEAYKTSNDFDKLLSYNRQKIAANKAKLGQ